MAVALERHQWPVWPNYRCGPALEDRAWVTPFPAFPQPAPLVLVPRMALCSFRETPGGFAQAAITELLCPDLDRTLGLLKGLWPCALVVKMSGSSLEEHGCRTYFVGLF